MNLLQLSFKTFVLLSSSFAGACSLTDCFDSLYFCLNPSKIFCPLRERWNLLGLSFSLNSCSLASCTLNAWSCLGEWSLPVKGTVSPLNNFLTASIVNLYFPESCKAHSPAGVEPTGIPFRIFHSLFCFTLFRIPRGEGCSLLCEADLF